MGKSTLVSTNAATALTTSYVAYELVPEYEVQGTFHGWHLAISLSIYGDASTTVQAFLTLDSGQVATLTGPSGTSSVANGTGTKGSAAILMGVPVQYPPTLIAGMTRGRVWVWIKVNATTGTPTLAAAGLRLFCTDSAGG
jgi:hypothetical protein